MKTFLVPVDFSSVTDDVIESASEFARALDGKVVLFHVVQPPIVTTTEYVLPIDVVREATDAIETNARKKLAVFAAKFEKRGVACRVDIKVGPPGPVILEEATSIKADYIIMGSHGHGKLFDFLVGSTASGVIKKAACGVIILPPAEKPKHG